MVGIAVTVGLICSVFVYVAFRHVSIHEKRDLKTFKKLTSKKKRK
jgi:hypothetical protein